MSQTGRHVVGAGGAHPFGSRSRYARAGWRSAAGLASIGAGAIHAAAAAAHAEHAAAMAIFVVLALCQVGWGLLALARIGRRLFLAGAVGNVAALAGWLMAKTTGIGFVPGLEDAERVQLADGLAAGLAAIALGCALATLAGPRRVAVHPALGAALTVTLAVAIAAATVAGVTAAPGHAHGGEHAAASATRVSPHRAARSHHGPSRRTTAGAIDLGGVEGVTPRQQARAEKLVAVTRRRLPMFADVSAARAAGYVSIGDAPSGHEHYVKWSSINDDRVLDPAHGRRAVRPGRSTAPGDDVIVRDDVTGAVDEEARAGGDPSSRLGEPVRGRTPGGR